MERTLVLVKPDGVQRGLIGEIISRLERRGLKLVGMKLMQVNDALARQHYGEHVDRPFFAGLVAFITSSPVVAMAWEAENAVEAVGAPWVRLAQQHLLRGPSGETWPWTSAATLCTGLTAGNRPKGNWPYSSKPENCWTTPGPTTVGSKSDLRGLRGHPHMG